MRTTTGTTTTGTATTGTATMTTTTTKVNTRVHHVKRGFLYWFSFLTLLAGVILAIVALTKDNITKVTFDTIVTDEYSRYCGWYKLHNYDTDVESLDNYNKFTYAKYCDDNNEACKMEEVGKAWYSLLIIGIVFGGIALIGFILDMWTAYAFALMAIGNVFFFACMLVAVITWGISKTCHKACNRLEFPELPSSVASCHAEWAISWILTVIAGGLSLASILSLIIFRSVAYKNY